MWRRSAGFTLIELLVAMSIFAMVALMAYSGLDIVMKAGKQGDAHAVKLAALQTAFAILERDIEQAVNRSIRNSFGDNQPAMEGDEEVIEFTRTGRRNPGGFSRSNLQRIAYGIEDEQLMRASWQVLDRAQDSEFVSGPLFEEVESIKFSYLDDQLEWHNRWPVQNLTQAAAPSPGLPRAIELIIESEQWGKIRRVFRVAGVPPP
ncbi:MAG: type II secretion system minor pseudopilin GspJ [Gammaproteobacteria bacterium]|nr:type II secretion system minor pseudopilin GspJ [Gammaproteobacteria bacterium]